MRQLWLLMDHLMENKQVNFNTQLKIRSFLEPIIMSFRAPVPLPTAITILKLLDQDSLIFKYGVSRCQIKNSPTSVEACFYDEELNEITQSRYIINTTGGNNIVDDIGSFKHLRNLFINGNITKYIIDNIEIGGIDYDPKTGRAIDINNQTTKNLYFSGQLLKGRQFNCNGVPLIMNFIKNTIHSIIS